MSFPIKHGDFPVRYERLPEANLNSQCQARIVPDFLVYGTDAEENGVHLVRCGPGEVAFLRNWDQLGQLTQGTCPRTRLISRGKSRWEQEHVASTLKNQRMSPQPLFYFTPVDFATQFGTIWCMCCLFFGGDFTGSI